MIKLVKNRQNHIGSIQFSFLLFPSRKTAFVWFWRSSGKIKSILAGGHAPLYLYFFILAGGRKNGLKTDHRCILSKKISKSQKSLVKNCEKNLFHWDLIKNLHIFLMVYINIFIFGNLLKLLNRTCLIPDKRAWNMLEIFKQSRYLSKVSSVFENFRKNLEQFLARINFWKFISVKPCCREVTNFLFDIIRQRKRGILCFSVFYKKISATPLISNFYPFLCPLYF